mgnify:FL=1|jgi:hypothetical protein
MLQNAPGSGELGFYGGNLPKGNGSRPRAS